MRLYNISKQIDVPTYSNIIRSINYLVLTLCGLHIVHLKCFGLFSVIIF